jgi:hypothetical protein
MLAAQHNGGEQIQPGAILSRTALEKTEYGAATVFAKDLGRHRHQMLFKPMKCENRKR